MIFFDNTISTSPEYNLAIEEFFFKQVSEDVIILWQSENAIVVGKHQNALSEINIPYTLENDISIVRRLSGGGAVYHDLGNLNFTFIQSGEKEKLVDFAKFIEPIIKALAELGLEASQGKRNEILLGGKKISGNAEHTFKNRVLHHGTLLYNSNLSTLVKSLRINPLKYQDKAIKSVQSRVCNISEVLPNMSFKEFRKHLATSLKKQFNVVNDFDFTDEIKVEVDNLVKEKYSKWEWNFGYSPSYTLNKSIYNDGNEVDIKITVKKGLIEKVETENEISETLRKQLNFFEGKSHKIEIIKGICESYGYVDYLDFF